MFLWSSSAMPQVHFAPANNFILFCLRPDLVYKYSRSLTWFKMLGSHLYSQHHVQGIFAAAALAAYKLATYLLGLCFTGVSITRAACTVC